MTIQISNKQPVLFRGNSGPFEPCSNRTREASSIQSS